MRDDPACRLSPPSPSLHEIPRQADYEFVCGDRSTWCRTTIDAEPMEVGLRLSHPHLAVHIPKHKFSLIAACGTRWVVPAFESLVQSIIDLRYHSTSTLSDIRTCPGISCGALWGHRMRSHDENVDDTRDAAIKRLLCIFGCHPPAMHHHVESVATLTFHGSVPIEQRCTGDF